MKKAVVIQARMGSTRKKGKISYLFDTEPMLGYQIKRLKENGVNDIIVATSTETEDDLTESIALKSGVVCFRGDEKDVMGRFVQCTDAYDLDVVVRVGGDDPFIDPNGINALFSEYNFNPELDLVYSSHPSGWIYGTAAELITSNALNKAYNMTTSAFEREHVVPFIKENKCFKCKAISPANSDEIRPDIYFSVDYQEDLDLVGQVISYFTGRKMRYTFTQGDLINIYDSGMLSINNKKLHTGF